MFKKLKIGTKIFWAFMLIAIIGSASGIVSVFLINRISTDADMALANYGFATGDIGSAIIMVTDSRRLCRDVVNFNNKVDATNAAKELETVKQKYSEYFEIVKKSVVDKEGQACINDIEKKAAYYNSVLDSIVVQASTASQAQRHALQNRMKSELDPAYNKLYDEYISLFEDKQTAGHALTEEFLLLSKFAIYGTIALTAGSIVFSLFLSFGIANGIAKPIRKAVGAAQNLDKGNLDITLDIESNDEIGMLSDTFLNMANGLKDIIEDINMLLGEMSIGNFRISSSCPKRYIGEYKKILDAINEINHKLSDALIDINVSSEQVSTGSNQVAIGSQALSQGATEQAASIEQLTHTIESISMQIGENSENCQHASLITNRTSDALNDGTVQMEEMIKAMVDISETSNEIEKIIKTIDDIAFQTNILALNAAVEAARAGSAGKGFAVVADEVRNLASKSAQAARNTTDLISRAVTSVEHGNRIASSTAKTINDVVLNASEVTKVVEKIAQASENQAISVMHVTEVMEQIATVVQTNSATAEESAAASEELSAQARMLKDLVATFILEDDREKEIEPICELETQTEKYN